jgi:hypothetical protein
MIECKELRMCRVKRGRVSKKAVRREWKQEQAGSNNEERWVWKSVGCIKGTNWNCLLNVVS